MKKLKLTKDWYSTKEAAEIWAYSDSATVRQMIDRGTVKAKRKFYRWKIHKNEIQRIFQKRLKLYSGLMKIVEKSKQPPK